MNIVLLSGGSGQRLWPLSNSIRSKQFIKIFENNGTYESMVQRMYRNILMVDNNAKITIATAKTQVSTIRNQLGENVGISVEPCRRDTFPAIALATAYLHDVMKVDEDDVMIVCPVDPYVNEDYFWALKDLYQIASEGDANLTLMGMEPTYPSEKYGYIIPKTTQKTSEVSLFAEKPDAITAERYIKSGALWNGGIFAYKIKYMLDKAEKITGFRTHQELFANYSNLKKISFDYAVAEKENNIKVMRFPGEWKDLGTWNTLTEALDKYVIGNGILDEKCDNVHIINELNVPILCMGLKNVVVSASPEGILVSDKEQSSYIKPYVDDIDDKIMFAEKSWGNFTVLDVEKESLTIKVTLNPGNKMNYHSHENRNETWNVLSGEGYVIIDGIKQNISPGDTIHIKAGAKHTVVAITEIKLIEVQSGEDISVEDKKKFPMPDEGELK